MISKKVKVLPLISILALGALLIQGCGTVARMHEGMLESAMGCMGMGGHGNHGGQTGAQADTLCQAVVYLDYKDKLGLSSDQIEKLKDLGLSCQKAVINKETEIKTAGLDYQSLLSNLARNKMKRPEVEAKGKAIGELYAEMLLIPVGYEEKALSILTTEQKERLGTASPPNHKEGYPGY